MREPGRSAIGTWSGGRFLHFGEAIEEDRLAALLRPGDGIDTVLTADAYGVGEADKVLGRALEGVDRGDYSLVGAVGHDFYEGERNGPKGFPRFTDPNLRSPDEYASYLRMATEKQLERVGADSFDLLLLHNPDRTGYSSEVVWDGMTALRDAGLTARMLLQVHDELIFEAPEAEADAVIAVAKAIMEKAPEPAVALSVPLVVDARAASNWDDAH